MLYGLPGSTKTRTAATAAWDERTAPVLHFDMGGNTRSVEDYVKQPDRILLETTKELNPFYNWLRKGQPANDPLVKQFELSPPYKTVVLDGVTGYQRGVFTTVSGQTNLGPGDIPVKFERGHYGQVLRTMTNFASLMFQLEMHVIVTALERSVLVGKVDEGGYYYFSPMLLGQSSTEVSAEAYAVARMLHIERLPTLDKKDISRAVSEKAKAEGLPSVPDLISVADFRTTQYQFGKDQHLINTPRMVNPTITKMLDRMDANRKAIERGENLVGDAESLEESHR